jgi:hypothetical protein
VTGARGALAVAVVLSGTRTAPAEPCTPRAQLDGDTAAVEKVAGELRKLGVGVGPGARGCRTVRAQVELDREGGIAVAIVDGSRRSEGRVVGDAGIAAAWIDSWLRDDLDGLGPAPAPESATPAAPAASAAPAPAPAPAPPPLAATKRADAVARASMLTRFALAAAYEQTWTEDDASASGIDAGACLRIGRACIGARVQYAREADRTVGFTAMSRSDASILATAGGTFSLGRMAVSPEFGLGVGRRHTQRIECSPPVNQPGPNCNPADPMCGMGTMPPPQCTDASGKFYAGDGLDVATVTPRIGAAVRLAVPLFEHVWLEGSASLTAAPFGHAAPFADAVPDPSTMPGSVDLSLPGEPWTAIQLGVGLRVGAR